MIVHPLEQHSETDGEGRSPDDGPVRIESDSLGRVEVPADAYWGVHTRRALDNFPISKRPISVYPELIVALASVKQAAARANRQGGEAPQKRGEI
mgnify:FL=1